MKTWLFILCLAIAPILLTRGSTASQSAAWKESVDDTVNGTRCIVSVDATEPALNPGVRNTPSIVVDFQSFSPLKTGFAVRLGITRPMSNAGMLFLGDKRFVLRIKDGYGWLWYSTNEAEVLDELRTVSSIAIRAIDSDRVIEDRYAVDGFAEAVDRLKTVCRFVA